MYVVMDVPNKPAIGYHFCATHSTSCYETQLRAIKFIRQVEMETLACPFRFRYDYLSVAVEQIDALSMHRLKTCLCRLLSKNTDSVMAIYSRFNLHLQ